MTSDFTVGARTQNEKLRNPTKKSGGGGLEYVIIFNKWAYTPHYAEHVIDPTDGRERLVMADPHTQFKAIIYDLETERIEWEFTVPGTAVHNPHTARMLLEDVEGFGSAGDIYCCDRDQHIMVVDRKTRTVKFSKSVPWTAGWVHEARLGVDKASLIVTDYSTHRLAKLKLPNLTEVWSRTDIITPSKVSVIEGSLIHDPYHNPSFGGEYLVASNQIRTGNVFEIKDSDGSTAWQSLKADSTGALVTAPHSAFRMGRVESSGNITVVGSEAGGGIYGLDYHGRPVFCIPSSLCILGADGSVLYNSTSRGLSEVTHVFPTLDSRIGFCAWSGLNSSIVGVITQLPLRQEGSFLLALNKASTETWTYLDPPIRAEEWDETLLVVKNRGTNSLDWKVDAYPVPYVDLNSPSDHMVPLLGPSTVTGRNFGSAKLVHPYKWYRVAVKSTTAESTTYDVYVAQRRK